MTYDYPPEYYGELQAIDYYLERRGEEILSVLCNKFQNIDKSDERDDI